MRWPQTSFRLSQFRAAKHKLTVFIVLLLLVGLTGIISIGFPGLTKATSTTWTSTADFASWTHTNTAATSNTLSLLSSGGGGPAVTIKTAAFPTPGEAPSAVWDTDNNLAYIFSGNNDDTSLGIYKYDPALDSLTTFTAEMPFWSSYASAVWNPTTDKAYIFGGDGGGNGDEILVFDPAANAGGGSITTLALTFPLPLWGSGAVWDNGAQKAYIFGGDGWINGDEIFVFDPAANGGLGSVTTLALTIPDRIGYNPAVWDADNNKAYIFGSAWGNGDEIYAFDPSANGGLGSIVTHSLTLPACSNYNVAVWDDTLNRANILGGLTCGDDDAIVVFDPNANSGAGSIATASVSLPSDRNAGAAVWADSNGKTYYFQGYDPDFTSDEIIEYFPGGGGYASSGSATIIYTPLIGGTNLWQSATANTTLSGQTLTLQYTSNPDCSTGLTSSISSVPISESICVKASLASSDPNTTPSLNDLTIQYSTHGVAETRTWTTTSDFNTWTKSQTESLNNSLSLTYTEDVGQLSTIESDVLPREFMGTASVYATVNNKFYTFGGVVNPDYFGARYSAPNILEYDPSTGAVIEKTAVLPTPLAYASAVWDPTNNVAYIFGGMYFSFSFGGGHVQTAQDSIFKYDPVADTITELTPTLPTELWSMGAVWDTANEVAYIIGGYTTIVDGSQVKSIVQFDPTGAGSVTTKTEMLPCFLGALGAVWNPNTNKAYLFGGDTSGEIGGVCGEDGSSTDKIFEYTPGTGVIREEADGLPTLPEACHSVAAAWDSSTNKAYVMGGSCAGGVTNRIVEFNPSANGGNGTTTIKSTILPFPRADSSGGFDPTSGLVYVIGGTYSDQILAYNPTDDEFDPLTFLPVGLIAPTAVYAPSQEKTYIFGGQEQISYGLQDFADPRKILEYDSTTHSVIEKNTFPAAIGSAPSSVWDSTNNLAYIFSGLNQGPGDPDGRIYKYNPASNALTQMTPVLPAGRRHYHAAVWDPNNQVAYIFGGINATATVTYDTILKFDPAANGGTGSLTTLSATLPTPNFNFSAVWNPNTNTALLFPGGQPFFGNYPIPATGDQIVEFDPAANGGNGSATLKLTIPFGYTGKGTAFWSTNRNRAYILGGPNNGEAGRNVREYNPATNTIREPVSGGGNNQIKTFISEPAVAWDSNANKAIILGGGGRGLLTNGPSEGVSYAYMDSIEEYTPGRRVYDSPGTATQVFTPSTGTEYIWQSIVDNVTLNSETSLLQFTNNPNCSTGLTTDITTLDESESICFKVTLSTAEESVTPTFDDLTVMYGIGIAAATPTPTPSSTPPPATPTPSPSATPSVTPTVLVSPTPTPTPTLIAQTTPEPSPSLEPSPSPTSTLSPTPNATVSPDIPPLVDSFSLPPLVVPLLAFIISLFAIGPPLLEFIPRLIMVPNNVWWGIGSWRKRKYALSRVVSSYNGQGVKGARVMLINPAQYNRVIDRTITDREGKFGFLAKAGEYIIRVSRATYRFPSKVANAEAYHGEPFTVESGQPIQVEIPIDPLSLKSRSWQWLTGALFKLQYLRIPFLILGTVLTIINLDDPLVPVWVSAIFITYYIVMWGIELSRSRLTNHVLKFVDNNDKPVPYLNIVLASTRIDREYPFLSNSQGEALVVVPKGDYILTIKTRDGHVITKEGLELKYGIFPKTMTWVIESQTK